MSLSGISRRVAQSSSNLARAVCSNSNLSLNVNFVRGFGYVYKVSIRPSSRKVLARSRFYLISSKDGSRNNSVASVILPFVIVECRSELGFKAEINRGAAVQNLPESVRQGVTK